jgi:hypothetical protein
MNRSRLVGKACVALGMLLVMLSGLAFVTSATADCTWCGEWNMCAGENPATNCGGGYACDDGVVCRSVGPCWCKKDFAGLQCHCA